MTGTERGVEFYTLALIEINIAAFQPFNTLDTGAEISMIKASAAQHIGTVSKKSNQSALHADGISPRVIVGETHIMLSRDNIELALDA